MGVSNFYSDRFVDLSLFSRIKPIVNQMETQPLCQQGDAHSIMERYGIVHEAWAPFGEGRGGLFGNPVLKSIGDKYGKTPAQVMLRWNIQRGVVVIPKSTHFGRMVENLDVFDFELSEENMERIGELDEGRSAFFLHADPSVVEWFAGLLKGQ